MAQTCGLKKNWNPIVDRFQAKLSKWKAKSLSFGGRLTLIKAVLGSLPTYYFSLFLAPNCVLDLLEKIRRRFLWGGCDEKRKINWVPWDKVIAEKEIGGLGVGSLKAFNRALLIKWWWRFRTEKSLLWIRVIQGIHNLYRKPANRLAKNTITGTWYNIASMETEVKQYGVEIDEIFVKCVRDGANTFFWWDKWIGDATLKSIFPDLYRLEKKKGCKISDRLLPHGPVWDWSANPIYAGFGVELNNLTTLLNQHVCVPGDDKWCCPISPDGSYYVHIVRKLLDKALAPPPWTPIIDWQHVIPIKVLCCIWKASLGRLSSSCELVKRGVLIDNLNCGQCINGLDEIGHILFKCPFACRVWWMVFDWCKITAPTPTSIVELVNFAKHWGNCPKKKKLVTSICYGTCWWLWRFRCDRRFKATPSSTVRLVDCVKSSTFNWIKYRGGFKSLNWLEWSMLPM